MGKRAKPKTLVFDLTPDEVEIFLEDANDCLQAMESGILHLEQKHDPETLNAIFRATHTLKAVVGTVGHHQMAELTHTLETILDEMRETKLTPTRTLVDKLLATVDVLKTLRDEIINQQSSGVEVASLLAQLNALKSDGDDSEQAPAAASSGVRQLTPEQRTQVAGMHQAGQIIVEIEVVTAAEAFAPAARLYQVAMALLEIGQIVAQQPGLDDLIEGDERLWLIVASQVELGDIEKLLSDIDDLAEFHVQPYTPERAGQPEHSSTPTGDVQGVGRGPDYSLDRPGPGQSEGTVRISIERLDTLMNLVGELVTNRTRLLQIEDMLRVQYGKNGGVISALGEMMPHFSHVVDQLQEEVMRARMLPIASLFNKFPRLVRDVARAAGKQVNLVIEGEATELDRSVIEAIGDPLIHLLRNAVGHGIEIPEVRLATGKPPTGTVRLTAASVEGQIVVIVADDGQGIDPNQIRQSVVKRGLFSESDEDITQLTDEEVIDLIFRPNLSTATQVTETSGRGVGLDVVRTNIERLGGSVMVTSEIGCGTTFQLTLPLTLALVQTMLVLVRNTLYAIPVTTINGALYLAEAKLNTVKGKPALDWQGEILPLLDLREIFARPHPSTSPSTALRAGLRPRAEPVEATSPSTSLRTGQTGEASNPGNGSEVKPSVVMVSWGKHRVGLAVDRIIGQQEIVVKSLSPMIGHVPGLSGATILGDGRIALIVDIAGLINAALRAQRAI
jgi:two-component system chemotaxis sensor kinase CheA